MEEREKKHESLDAARREPGPLAVRFLAPHVELPATIEPLATVAATPARPVSCFPPPVLR